MTAIVYFSALYLGITVYTMAIKRTSVIMSIALGALLYKEMNIREHILGALVMLFGCLCITI